jgi:hypothetical protein
MSLNDLIFTTKRPIKYGKMQPDRLSQTRDFSKRKFHIHRMLSNPVNRQVVQYTNFGTLIRKVTLAN